MKKNQKGQILLIVIMAISTLLTVALSTSFKSSTETQLTKMEEESQKALSAAQSAIETALKQGGSVTNIGTLPGLSDFQGSATYDTSSSNTFVSPVLQKDEQYTFYLADYNDKNNTFSNFWSGNLTICFASNNIEITTIRSDNTISKIYPIVDSSVANCPQGENFSKSYTLTSVSNIKILIVRLINNSAPSKIGFYGTNPLRLQGKKISSSATSPGGVTKKVELFQSYPQIPAEFFVTTF